MSNFLNGLKDNFNQTTTENGAAALKSTGNACLDAFGSLGAMRQSDEQTIINKFAAAFEEDEELALRMLFYIRDITDGLGERRVFRVIARWLANKYPMTMCANFENFMFYGRADDIYTVTEGTAAESYAVAFIKHQLSEDIDNLAQNKPISLLAKWLPSENASSKETTRLARKLAKSLGLTNVIYRKMLSILRAAIGLVETQMCQKHWDSINYETIPGQAMLKYKNAFERHDNKRFSDFVLNSMLNKAKLNAKTLMPNDLYRKAQSASTEIQRNLVNALWEAQPNYFEGRTDNALCMVDVSGSMWGEPLSVAVSLGIYCADKCHGPFHNHFLTFSAQPQLVELHGTFCDKVSQMERADWGMNTNIEAAFDLILKTALRTKCKQEDLPETLYIISDMQFDEANGSNGYSYDWYGRRTRKSQNQTFMAEMKAKFEQYGYTMPNIVYWNVRASECGMFQEKYQGQDCAMVSGYSASLFKAVLNGTTYEVTINNKGKIKVEKHINPMDVMINTLRSERYDRVVTDTTLDTEPLPF